jgi:hypothetical protein
MYIDKQEIAKGPLLENGNHLTVEFINVNL